MASINKVKGYSVGRLFQHHNRKWDDGVEHSNENIDLARTPLNVSFKEGKATDVSERLKTLYHMDRKNLTVLEEAIVTLPQDVQEEDVMPFFHSVYNFYENDFEIENAIIHFDEVTPHIHIDFYPILPIDRDDLRENRPSYLKRIEKYEKEHNVTCNGILNGKEVINRVYLQNMHPRLLKWVTEDLGYPCEILNGATDNGNRTVISLKNETLQRRSEELETKIDSLQDTYNELAKTNMDRRYCNYQGLLAKINYLETENDAYSYLVYENGLDLDSDKEDELRELKNSIPRSKINIVRINRYDKPKEDVVTVVPIKIHHGQVPTNVVPILEKHGIDMTMLTNTENYCEKHDDVIVFTIPTELSSVAGSYGNLVRKINECEEKNIIVPALTNTGIEIPFLEKVLDSKEIYIERKAYFDIGDSSREYTNMRTNIN